MTGGCSGLRLILSNSRLLGSIVDLRLWLYNRLGNRLRLGLRLSLRLFHESCTAFGAEQSIVLHVCAAISATHHNGIPPYIEFMN